MTLRLGTAIRIGAIVAATARAQTVHYIPGSFNIRDFGLPDPGFYGAIYNYAYMTDNLKDANGNQISSITITGLMAVCERHGQPWRECSSLCAGSRFYLGS
jgi:hypothetical protein